MGNGYSVNTLDATINTNLGTPTNTGGTAAIGSMLGDFANVTLVNRIPTKFTGTTTLNVNNTTGSLTIATLTGSIAVLHIIGRVTTVISANATATHLRLNDGTNTPAITLASGTTISAAAVGSILVANSHPGVAVVLANASQARVTVPADDLLSSVYVYAAPCILTANNAATTTMEIRYTTTDAPSSGAIAWEILYYPIGSGALA